MFMANNIGANYIDESVKSASPPLPLIEYEWIKVKSGMDKAKLEIDSQDNIIFVASQPFPTNNESVIMKYNSNGVLLWEKTWSYWNETWSTLYVEDLVLDSFDNIYLTGFLQETENDLDKQIFVRKYNSEGILQWHIEIGDEDNENVDSIRIDQSGDVVLSGDVWIDHTDDVYLMILKLDSHTGNQIWSKLWAMDQYTYGTAMELDYNDNIYILCNFELASGANLVKFDQNGNFLWNTSVFGVGERMHDIGIDNEDNLYVLADTTNFSDGRYLCRLIKYDNTGSMLWVNFPVMRGDTIHVDYNNNIYIPGKDYSVMKWDRFGNNIWNLTQSGNFYYEFSSDIATDSSGYLYYVGKGMDFLENPSCFLVKHDNTADRLIYPKFDKRNLYALLIGIENYPGTEYDLTFCLEDANSINWYLSGECDVSGDTIVRLYNSLGTNDRINAELDYIKSVITPEDGFFMYFSGHGAPGAFCSYDTFEYLYSDLDLHFDEMNCSNKILLIDTCESGSLVQDFSGEDVYVMASCLEGEISTESFQFIGGVFTNYFYKSSKHSYDTNSDGALSLEEQFPYVLSQVSSYAEQYSYSQHPVQLDNNEGPTILYPGIRDVTFRRTENKIYYDFDVDGYGQIYHCNLTAIYQNKYQVYDLTNSSITRTGFGHFTGFIEMTPDHDVSLELVVGIKGHRNYRKFIYTETLKFETNMVTIIIHSIAGLTVVSGAIVAVLFYKKKKIARNNIPLDSKEYEVEN